MKQAVAFDPDHFWHAEQLNSGKWVVVRLIYRGRFQHKEVLDNGGAFVRFDTAAMANLMAGKLNR